MILDFGYVCMELHSSIPAPLKQGTSYLGENCSMQIGGSGALQAIAAARAGARVFKIGFIGSDLMGDTIKTIFRREGINCNSLTQTDDQTGLIQTITDATNESTTIVHKGANARFSSYTLPEKLLNERTLVLLHDQMDMETNRTILEIATEANSPKVMSIQGDKMPDDDILSMLDIALISTKEHILQTNLCQSLPISADGFDCFCGTFVACIKAKLPLARAINYATHAQDLFVVSVHRGYNALPYLSDIEETKTTAL